MKLGLFDLNPFGSGEGKGFTAGTKPLYNLKNLYGFLKSGAQAGLTLDPKRFKDKIFESNWYLTRAHPGTDATRDIVQDGLGIDIQGNTRGISRGVGGLFGGALGPIGGGIAGGAAGWGLSSQFGDKDDSSMGWDSALQGAGVGIASGLLFDKIRDTGGAGAGEDGNFLNKFSPYGNFFQGGQQGQSQQGGQSGNEIDPQARREFQQEKIKAEGDAYFQGRDTQEEQDTWSAAERIFKRTGDVSQALKYVNSTLGSDYEFQGEKDGWVLYGGKKSGLHAWNWRTGDSQKLK